APMPGVLALLDRLEQSGVPKAVTTSSGKEFTAGVLGRFDLAPRFQFQLCAEDVENGKPNPEIYLKAAERFDVAPSCMLVLEDSQIGFQAARASGAICVAVPGDHSRNHNFPDAALILDSLKDPRLGELLRL
ncbi:MAG: HAD-IA family hydrolase, partial [Planctomycetales bacterium]